MLKACVITSIYGHYDTLKPIPPQTITSTKFLCVTSDKHLNGTTNYSVLDESEPGVHPRIAAKFPKIIPWSYSRAEYLIWVDASAEITSETFVEDMINACGDSPIAQFMHPDRDCIYDELEACVGMPKYEEHLPRMREQVEHYRAQGHPENWGLWATGLIVRKNTPETEKLGSKWLADVYDWSYQDQLSQAPNLRSVGMRPKALPYSLRENPWLTWHPHRSEF
jgi:hypothetical protein